MYLPYLGCYSSADRFGVQFTAIGDGVEGFSFPYINPSCFHPFGILDEFQFSAFMKAVDSVGMTVHHISTRWGCSIPRAVLCTEAVVFSYHGNFGQGFACAFRTGDGCADLWYILYKGV